MKYSIWFALLCLLPDLHAQTVKIELGRKERGTGILEELPGSMRMAHAVSLIELQQVIRESDTLFRIHAAGYLPNYQPGMAELPEVHYLIEYPAGSEPQINLISLETDTVYPRAHGILGGPVPSRLSDPKSAQSAASGSTTDFKYTPELAKQREPVRFTPVGRSRGLGIGRISIAPFSYEQDLEALIIRNNLVFEISWPLSAETSYKSAKTRVNSPLFKRAFRPFLHSSAPLGLPVKSDRPVKYVILSDTIFRETLQPLIRWKTEKGFEVIELYRGVNGIGTSGAELKASLTALYDMATAEDPPPLYLLIAGDVEHIPASPSGGQFTDLYYAEYDGGEDYLPELFYGRFSAADTHDMRILVEKTLQHERYAFPDPGFLERSILIAGMDGQYAAQWGNGQLNYMNRYYMNTEHGNEVFKFLYPESGGQADSIRAMIGQGASLVNYTGHGYPDRWDHPRFSQSQIPELQNNDRYALMIGNGCQTGTFYDPECFAEALVRAEGKGAYAYIGCTNDSYWDEDYYWAVGVGPVSASPLYEETGLGVFDRMYHEKGEPIEEWYPALGQILFAGNTAVMAGNLNRARYYWEIYHLFGDPSLIPFLSVPRPIQADHSRHLHPGSSELKVFTEPFAYAGLTMGDILLDGGLADENGELMLQFPAAESGSDSLLLTLTGQNYQPRFADIRVLPDSMPYVDLRGFLINDPTGNGNHAADYGELLGLSFQLYNHGPRTIDSLRLTLQCQDPLVEVRDSMAMYLAVDTGLVSFPPDELSLELADSVPHGTRIRCKLKMQVKPDFILEHFFEIPVRSPMPAVEHYHIDDRKNGNGNGVVDPGEMIELIVQLTNLGDSPADSFSFNLENRPGLITLQDSSRSEAQLDPAETVRYRFAMTGDTALRRGQILHLPVMMKAPPYEQPDSLAVEVGSLYEGFESGSFRMRPWMDTSAKNIPWQVRDESAYEGRYAARSGQTSDADTSDLGIRIHIPGDDSISFHFRVSSESGYDFLIFFIDSVETGRWSGEKPWQVFSTGITAGTHLLSWLYIKDSNTSRGTDAAWIDAIRFPSGSFSRENAGIMDLIAPAPGTLLPLEDTVQILVRNYGSRGINDLPLCYVLNDTLLIRDTLQGLLPADTMLAFRFDEPVHMIDGAIHRLKVFSAHPLDGYRGNDTLLQHYTPDHFYDAGMVALLRPDATDSSFSHQETVVIRIRNHGNLPVDSIPISLELNGTLYWKDIVPDTIRIFDSLDYTLPIPLDLSLPGAYDILVYLDLADDRNRANDSIRSKLIHREINTPAGPGFDRKVLLVYPNPGNGRYHIRLPAAKPETADIRVFHMDGRMIREHRALDPDEQGEWLLDLQNIPAGSYILSIKFDYAYYNVLLMKQ